MASCTSRCRITSGPSTHEAVASSGTTSGRPPAGIISATGVSLSTRTGCTSRRRLFLISLNLKDGKERWRRQICDIDRFYYASVAPTVVKDHLIVGVSGDDFDIPGYIQSHHPESGAMQWRWYTVPVKPGDHGMKSWPNEEMAGTAAA